jgi:hypothetical protein
VAKGVTLPVREKKRKMHLDKGKKTVGREEWKKKS